MTYKILNYSTADDNKPRPGLLIDDQVYDLRSTSDAMSEIETIELFESWGQTKQELEKLADNGALTDGKALSDVTLHAPLLYPRAIFCAAGNYHDHIKEMDHGYEIDKTKTRPYFFLKAPPDRAITGQDRDVKIPDHSSKLDWEAEVAVIIGREAKNVSVEDAMQHVAGYTIINDLSARDHLFREDWPQFKTDWFGQKCFDQSVPMGPWITPADEVPDITNLEMKLWINDELKQDTGTKFMIFSIAEQISALSRQITLRPADLIATGTGSGVGGALASGEKTYLKSGDVIRISIEKLGTLENRIA